MHRRSCGHYFLEEGGRIIRSVAEYLIYQFGRCGQHAQLPANLWIQLGGRLKSAARGQADIGLAEKNEQHGLRHFLCRRHLAERLVGRSQALLRQQGIEPDRRQTGAGIIEPDEAAPAEIPDLPDRTIPMNEEHVFFSAPSINDRQDKGAALHIGAHRQVFQRGQGDGIHLATLQSLFQCDDSVQDHGPGIRLEVYLLRYRLGPHLEKNLRIGLVDVHEQFGRKTKTERVGGRRRDSPPGHGRPARRRPTRGVPTPDRLEDQH